MWLQPQLPQRTSAGAVPRRERRRPPAERTVCRPRRGGSRGSTSPGPNYSQRGRWENVGSFVLFPPVWGEENEILEVGEKRDLIHQGLLDEILPAEILEISLE